MSQRLERTRILKQIRVHKDNLKSRKEDFRNAAIELYEWVVDESNNITGHGINDNMRELSSILEDIRRIESILKELQYLNELCHF